MRSQTGVSNIFSFTFSSTLRLLDAFARRPLWQDGMEYGHGTGHGIGAYLNVHEGPAQSHGWQRRIFYVFLDFLVCHCIIYNYIQYYSLLHCIVPCWWNIVNMFLKRCLVRRKTMNPNSFNRHLHSKHAVFLAAIKVLFNPWVMLYIRIDMTVYMVTVSSASRSKHLPCVWKQSCPRSNSM